MVKVEDSAYHHPNTRILIPLYNDTVGTINGGYLESEITKKT